MASVCFQIPGKSPCHHGGEPEHSLLFCHAPTWQAPDKTDSLLPLTPRRDSLKHLIWLKFFLSGSFIKK